MPEQLFEIVNKIMNGNAIYMSKFKLVTSFKGILQKYLKYMLIEYTKFYYFKLSNQKCFYKVNANSIEVHEFTFCENPNNVREALLRELFGETSVQSVIQNKNILLLPFGRMKIPNSKLQSLGNKYSTIYANYLWYYPNLDEDQDFLTEKPKYESRQ